MITIGSLFDGICGFPYAGQMAGAETLVSKLKTDAAIYKAAGNSLAIPCAYDVLRRCVDDEWNRQTGMF